MKEFLGKYTKNILLLLADEFETNVSATDKKKRSIIHAILVASDYDEDFAKSNVECILKENTERKENLQREKTREYKIENLRIQYLSETVSLSSSDMKLGAHRNPKINLRELVLRSDSKLIEELSG